VNTIQTLHKLLNELNNGAMARNKGIYGPDADLFRPERFLEGDLRDPERIVFGFGCRWVWGSQVVFLVWAIMVKNLPRKIFSFD